MASANQHNATLKDVPAQSFISFYARHLQRAHKVPLPKWHDIVKTGIHKELAPQDSNWFYVRLAAIARRLYLRNGVGVGALQKIFGGRKRNGSRPSHFQTGSGSIARYALKSLEKLGLAEIVPKKGGRRLSPNGRKELDQIAKRVLTQVRSKRAPVIVQAPPKSAAQVASQAPGPDKAKVTKGKGKDQDKEKSKSEGKGKKK